MNESGMTTEGFLDTSAAMFTNGTSAPEADDPEAYLYDVAEKIFLYIDPFITFGGILGNMLMFLVMQRKSQKDSPVAVFMSGLAITDSVVLILDFLNNWLKYGPRIYLLGYTGFCEFHRYFFNVAYTYASWLVMGVAVERFLVVWFPLKAKDLVSVRSSVIAVIVMAVVLCVLYLYNLWGYYISPEGTCDVHPNLSNFQNNVSPWLTAVLYSYIPLIIILISNIAIIYRLAKASSQRKKMAGGEKDEIMLKITRTVVVICTTFFILTTPVTLFYIIIFAAGEFIEQGPRTALAETFILILALSNHSINFLLYVLTSDSFRVEVLDMLRIRKAPGRRGPESSSGMRTGTTGATSSTRAESSVMADQRV